MRVLQFVRQKHRIAKTRIRCLPESVHVSDSSLGSPDPTQTPRSPGPSPPAIEPYEDRVRASLNIAPSEYSYTSRHCLRKWGQPELRNFFQGSSPAAHLGSVWAYIQVRISTLLSQPRASIRPVASVGAIFASFPSRETPAGQEGASPVSSGYGETRNYFLSWRFLGHLSVPSFLHPV